MHAPENSDLNLRVVVGNEAGSVVDEGIKDRASTMLKTVIQTTSRRGSFVYMILGLGTLPNPSQYWMEVSPASENLSSNMVHVIIRSSTASQGTLMGMLKLPDGVERQEFLDAIKLAIDRFNGSGWHGIVAREERASMQVSIQEPSRQIRRGVESDDDLTPKRAVPRPAPIDGQTALALAQGQTVRVGGGRLRQGPAPRSLDRTQPVARPPSARSAIQPGIGAELAAKPGGAPWTSPRPAGAVFPVPFERKGSVVDQSAVAGHSVVFAQEEGCALGTIKRARAMLEYLLEQAKLLEGTYGFCVTGRDEPGRGSAGGDPCITFLLGGKHPGLQVRIRSKGGTDGCISGFLSLPEGMDTESSFRIMSSLAARFNADRWQVALDDIPPEPPPMRVPAASPVRSVMSPPLPPPTQPEGALMATTKPLEDETKLVQFLIAALQLPEVENGVITTSMVTALIKQRFNPANPKTFAGPLFAKLKSLGHVLHTGYGQFQVTQAFIRTHKLVIEIKALPEYHKGDAGAGKNSRGGNGTHHEPTLAELLQNRQAMEAMIRETALREHGALKRNIADLQTKLEAAQTALSAFEEEHAALLRAEAVPANVPAATGVKADRPH